MLGVIIIIQIQTEKLNKCVEVLITGSHNAEYSDTVMLDYDIKNNIAIFGVCQGMQDMCVFNTDDNIIKIPDEIDHPYK